MTVDTPPLLDALLERGGGDFPQGLAAEVPGRLMACDVEGTDRRGRVLDRGAERGAPALHRCTARAGVIAG